MTTLAVATNVTFNNNLKTPHSNSIEPWPTAVTWFTGIKLIGRWSRCYESFFQAYYHFMPTFLGLNFNRVCLCSERLAWLTIGLLNQYNVVCVTFLFLRNNQTYKYEYLQKICKQTSSTSDRVLICLMCHRCWDEKAIKAINKMTRSVRDTSTLKQGWVVQ